MSLVTLLSDFGTVDGYVGAMKGVIKSMAPHTELIDITHEIAPFSISRAAYTILNYYNRFPKGTVHVCVVDPGVGSDRKGLILQTEQAFFVGPDNGLFDLLVLEQTNIKFYEIHSVVNSSSTFHGRDIFAPVAARLAMGTDPALIGKRISRERPKPAQRRQVGNILYVPQLLTDHFGNIIFAIKRHELSEKQIRTIRFKGHKFNRIQNYYAEAAAGGLLCLWNSLNFLEVAQNKGSAAEYFKATAAGDDMEIHLDEK